MNITEIASFVTLWLILNVAALLVLAVLSYFTSRWALEALPWLERMLLRLERARFPKAALSRVTRRNIGQNEVNF
jgi:hypothetical protein